MYNTIREFIEEWNQEAGLTQKVFDTLTDASLKQEVSSEGRNLGRIAWHIVISIPDFLSNFGFTIELDGDLSSIPASAKEIAESFRKFSTMVTEAAKRQWTDESLKQVQNAFGRDLTNAAILSLLIKHIIHHRGQLTVLMRQAMLKIPGVYGPSKDEWCLLGSASPKI